MLPLERRTKILQVLEEQGRATVQELTARLEVSGTTVRSDLQLMEDEGLLIRTHGGAVPSDRTRAEMTFAARSALARKQKARIGAAAASLVSDGDSVVLDASTTALQVARHLKTKCGLTVVTNGLQAALELAPRRDITTILLGGVVRETANSTVGSLAEEMGRQFHCRFGFFGARGLAIPAGLTDANLAETQLKARLVESVKHVIAVLDSSKLGHVDFIPFAGIHQIHTVVTDRGAPEALVAQLREQGVDVRLV